LTPSLEQERIVVRLLMELFEGYAFTRKLYLLKVGDFLIYFCFESKNSPLSKSTTGSSEGVI